MNNSEAPGMLEQRCDKLPKYYLSLQGYCGGQRWNTSYSWEEHRAVGVGKPDYTILGIKDVTVSASLPSTSHTCEIPQFNGKDINHLRQHICLKRRHQHEDLATLNQLKEEHLPDIFIVVLLIVHLPFFLWFVLLAYLY